MSKAERDLLPGDTVVLKKRYVDADGHTIFVSIVMSGRERASIHRPQVCLVGQGNEIVDSDVQAVPIAGREPLDVMVKALYTIRRFLASSALCSEGTPSWPARFRRRRRIPGLAPDRPPAQPRPPGGLPGQPDHRQPRQRGPPAQQPDYEFIHHNVTEYIDLPGPVDYIWHFASPASPSTTSSCPSRRSRSAPWAPTRRWAGQGQEGALPAGLHLRMSTATRWSIRSRRPTGAT
jgi:hypothetical protein